MSARRTLRIRVGRVLLRSTRLIGRYEEEIDVEIGINYGQLGGTPSKAKSF